MFYLVQTSRSGLRVWLFLSFLLLFDQIMAPYPFSFLLINYIPIGNSNRFLDKAMIIDDHDASSKRRNSWRLCSVTQVEEVKLVLRLIPLWLSCLMFCAVQTQSHTFFTKQGKTLIRSIGPHYEIPPASLLGFVGLTIFIGVPIYDRVFVPAARKLTGHHSGTNYYLLHTC